MSAGAQHHAPLMMEMGELMKIVVTSVLILAAMQPLPSAAQSSYATMPISIISIFPAGGGIDVICRAVAQKMVETMKQQVIVENRPGAGSLVAATAVARSDPDGYTLTIGSNSTLATNVVLEPSLPFDPRRDFAAISMIVTAANILIVHPSLAAHTTADFIKLARSNTRKLNYSSFGDGSSAHLTGEMFKSAAGVDMVHIPYKGTPPAVTDLIAGQVSMMFANTLSVLPYVNSGRLRALAISSIKRSAAAPSLPTIAESGMPGFDSVTWFGLLAPTGVPREAINRLNPELRRIVQSKALADLLIAQGADPIGSSAEEFAARIKADIAKFTVIIKTAGVRAE
jgi:tripartite-type tricarboxylate transporter receptor subunit TctC